MSAWTILTLLSAGLFPGDPGSDDSPTRRVADAYLSTLFEDRDLDEAETWMAEDATFIDPTADLWGGNLANGISGRDAIMAKMQSFQGIEAAFRPEVTFDCGRTAVRAGRLDWKSALGPPIENLPFVTILEVDGELVAARRDYGDYDSFSPGFPTDPNLAPRAKAYLEAYAAFDVDALREFWHDDVVFQDPTARLIGDGQRSEGIDAVAALITRISDSGSVLDFSIEPVLEFASNHHAVFAGTTHFTLTGASLGLDVESVSVEQPIVVALEVRDGRVHEHLDFTDYTVLAEKVQALSAEQERDG